MRGCMCVHDCMCGIGVSSISFLSLINHINIRCNSSQNDLGLCQPNSLQPLLSASNHGKVFKRVYSVYLHFAVIRFYVFPHRAVNGTCGRC